MAKVYLLVAAVVLCLAGSAHAASVAGSVHDFSALGFSPCSYCHSIHHGLGGTALMNSEFGTFPAITKVYSSATRKIRVDINNVNTTDARLCLACHDLDNVNNLATTSTAMANVKQRLVARNDPGIYINTDLSNDHPVGLVYDVTKNPEGLKAPTTARVGFGVMRDQMWCSSCHNVHNNANGFFLVMSNEGSALCLDCHKK